MTVKEKLVELLSNAHSRVTEADMAEDMTYARQLEMEADYLIENGVTVQRWIPVTERVPKHMQPVLVCRNDGKVEQGYKDVNDWWKVYGTRTKKITHWMPLPEPPKED